jgi:hypothetical protein
MACSSVVAALRLVALCGSVLATSIAASTALAMKELTSEFFKKPETEGRRKGGEKEDDMRGGVEAGRDEGG